MQDRLNRIIESLKADRRLISFDEAATKQAVIARLLDVLGWDFFNIDEVQPEYSVGTGRVDFALRINNTSKIFIEVKRIGEDLEKHQGQLLSYSFRQGVKLAILTNGITWWFYLPLNEGAWEQRRFYMVDLVEQDTKDIVERFIEFLAKENIRSGEAIKSAECLYKSKQRKQILLDAIPKAWMKIISDPDDRLVELLIETTEKISGFRPEIADVEKFLKENYSIKHSLPTTGTRILASKASVPVPSLPFQGQYGDYINKMPQYFVFLGKEYHPKNWQELLLTVANELYHRHKADFRKCLDLRGSKMAYFSTNPNDLSYPKQIADSEYYAEAKLNSNSVVRRSRDLMKLFGYKESDLQIVAQ